MINEDKEKLVKLIASGINTYADIEEILPGGAVASAMVDYTDGTSLHLIYPVNKDAYFKSDTIFALTDDGKDILYQSRKEKKQFLLTLIGMFASIIAAITGIIACIL